MVVNFEKEKALKNRLRKLYALQQIDSSLAELQEMKGDLPVVVASLEAKLQELELSIQKLDETIKTALMERDRADLDAAELREKIERNKDRLYHVRSNREYDALTKEIDQAIASSSELEKLMDALADKARLAREEKEKVEAQRRDVEAELSERRKELEAVSKTTEEEELQLQHKREKLVVRIQRVDLEEYERIRNAKGGVAVVPIRRGACGGCFNVIPPQRILEIRMSERIYTCEHCGRILVSDEVAESSADFL